MKIGLWAKHSGLIWLLNDLWKGRHSVRLAPRWDTFQGGTWQGDEDVIVSTLPYEPESLSTGKPTIVYYTDPTFPEYQKNVQTLFTQGKISVIGAEDCYCIEQFVDGVEYFVPFAINPANYPKYTGTKKEIVIANRKPHTRWEEVIRGATGVGMNLDKFLNGLPWRIINEETSAGYKRALSEARVLFYFSNSPYTIVLFEAMAIGIPIVAFNHTHRCKSRPVEKYVHCYSTDYYQIREWLSNYLLSPPVTNIVYPNLPFFDAVEHKWDVFFEEAAAKGGRIA